MAGAARPIAGKPEPAQVLTRAFLRAGEQLEVPRRVMARIVGVSEASLSRLAGGREIRPETKEGELALVFVRLFRSLDALLGGNVSQSREWFHAMNHHLSGRPVEMVQTAAGLIHVVDYLDAMRGSVSSPNATG